MDTPPETVAAYADGRDDARFTGWLRARSEANWTARARRRRRGDGWSDCSGGRSNWSGTSSRRRTNGTVAS